MLQDQKIGDVVSRKQRRGPLAQGSKDLLLPVESIAPVFPNAVGREAPGSTRIVAAIEGVVHAYHRLLGGNDKGQTLWVVHGFHYLKCLSANEREWRAVNVRVGGKCLPGQKLGQAAFCRKPCCAPLRLGAKPLACSVSSTVS